MSVNVNMRFWRFWVCAGAIFAIIALLAVPRPAQAQYMTGNDLMAGCAAGSNAAAINRCIGYVAGVIDYHVVMQSLGTNPTTDFCLPKTLKVEEAAVSVVAYIKAHPDQAGFIAAPAVALALNALYPCAKAQ